MINVTQLVPEFRAADQQAIINAYNLGELRYKEFFPSFYTTDLTFRALQATTSAKVAADVVPFDSRAPRKSRPTPGTLTGDIPKIEIARVKQESDMKTYRQLIANINTGTTGSAQSKRRLIDWMYEDAPFTLDGVNARLEWLSKQAASNGKYSLTLTNNAAGIQTKVDVDFQLPNANRTNASVDWNTSATAKPITDLQLRQDTARAKGFRYNYAFMNQETFSRMANTAEVQKFAASFGANALNLQLKPSLQTVNQALREQGLPQIIIWDSYVTLEQKDGTQTSESGWVDGNVTLSENPTLGDTYNSDTADAFVTFDNSIKSTNDFILVKTWAEQDPITVVTKAVAYATPVLQNISRIGILKTKLS